MFKRLLGLATLALLATLGGALVYRNTGVPVVIQVGGQTQTALTHATTLEAAVREAGFTLYPEDLVRPAREAPPTANLTITVKHAAFVMVQANGVTHTLRTHLTSPLAILSTLKVNLTPSDSVWADGVLFDPSDPPALSPPSQIRVRAAIPIVIIDGEPKRLSSAARTVGEAVWAAGYPLYAADELSPAPDTPLTPNVQITVRRARPVTLLADGQTLTTRTRGATVGEVLTEVRLALVGEDYTLPAPDQPVPAEGLIRLVRVRENVLSEQKVIPYAVAYQPLPEQAIDNVSTLQAGVNGLNLFRVRVRYEDGAEVSRVDEGELVAQSPVTHVIGYGTQITLRTVDTPDGPVEYWRAYTMYATSYSASRAGVPSTARNFGRTASGQMLVKGLVAIDRRMMPFGTRMYVPGYGFATAADTGGGVKGRFIDLGYDDWNYQSWHQVVTVYFLTPIPSADQIRWIIPTTVP